MNDMNSIKMKYMCDRCLQQLGEQEDMFAFKLIDDDNVEKVFKGHEGCIKDTIDILKQIYGKKENE